VWQSLRPTAPSATSSTRRRYAYRELHDAFQMKVAPVFQGSLFAAAVVLSSCAVVSGPTVHELQRLETPPADISARIDRLLPSVVAWYDTVEAELLSQGRPLVAQEIQTARRVGVKDPGKVRVVVLETFPMPANGDLLAAAKRYGLGSPSEGGRSNGHLIMLKPWVKEDATVLAHELVHVGQHDRMGRLSFLRRYLVEMEVLGYARSPLELDAYARQAPAP
jgi:hypothetical protein